MTTRTSDPIQRAIQISPAGQLDPSFTSRTDQIRRTRVARTTAAAPTATAIAGTATSPPPPAPLPTFQAQATAPPPAVATSAPTATTKTQAAQPAAATAPTRRQGLVDVIFGSGAGTGDAAYWYEDRPGENNDLVNAAVRGLQDPAQRAQILDYLFASGLAQGDRAYWDTNRGAEESALVGVLNRALGGTVGQGDAAAGDTPSKDKDVNELRDERLAAALAAIEAQFNTQQGSLEGQQSALGSLFDLSMLQNQRGQEQSQRQIEGNAASRGLGRSGVFGRNLVEGLVPFEEQRQDLIGRIGSEPGAEGTEVRQIMSQLLLLDQQRASAESMAKIDSAADKLDLEQIIALINAGLQ